MKLEELSKFALALNSPAAGRSGTPSKLKKKHFTELQKHFDYEADKRQKARDNQAELSAIRNIDELHIDYRRALSIKRGDLAIIQGEVFRACPVAAHLQDIPLIVKRLDCVDRRTYDLKIYEADTLSRFQGHTNIVSLYSYWSEKPSNPYTYKTLVLSMEEGILGDLLRTIVQNPIRPTGRQSLKYICDIAKALIAVHNSNIIHCRVKPSSIYLSSDNTAMLGEFGKVELDSARQTHQLFSKVLIGEAIPHTLVYWAPELLKLDKYGKQVDMWALGVTIYQMVTGKHPFNVEDEHAFRDDALTANANMATLEAFPRIATIVENLLIVNPEERWTAQEVLTYAQFDFASDVQRMWRGYRVRKEYERVRESVIKIQAHIKGWLTYVNYWRDRAIRRNNAATKLQARYRTHTCRTTYKQQRNVLMRCQANVLCKQTRRAYLTYRDDVMICQAVIRGFLATRWYKKVQLYKRDLETKLLTVQSMIQKYQQNVQEFMVLFANAELPPALAHLESFEDFELAQPPPEYGSVVCLPKLRSANAHIQGLDNEIKDMRMKMQEHLVSNQEKEEEEEKLRRELGSKYCELEPMVEALKKNLKRVEEACSRAVFMPIRVQHPYSYSKWDSVHEPSNVVENTLKDDETMYRALSPVIDLTLCNGSTCFVSEVYLYPGDCGPSSIEIYTSNIPDKWNLVSSFRCSRDQEQIFHLPGEQLCRYLRVRLPNNVRGGNIVSVRMVKIRGLVKE